MSERHYRIAFVAMATIGVLVLLVTIVIQLVGVVLGHPYEIPHTVYYAGMVIGFVGFYGLDSKRAKDGGQFLVDSATRFIVAIRTGRRSTDVAVVTSVAKPSTPASSDDPDAQQPQGTSGGKTP